MLRDPKGGVTPVAQLTMPLSDELVRRGVIRI
jgi:hypothetical protein